MKRFTLIIAILGLCHQLTLGQSFNNRINGNTEKSFLSVSAVTLKSARGVKFGFDFSYNTKKDFQIGVFSYRSTGTTETGVDTFQGFQFGFPLVRMNNWTIGTDQKIGVYNKRFVSILPTLKVSYKATNRLTGSVGAGVSDRLLVLDFKLSFKL